MIAELGYGVMCAAGLVLSQKLGSAKTAIARCGSQKAVAVDMGLSESRLTRKLQGDADAVLNLRDLDKMPVPVQQHFHFLEVLRLGLPSEIRHALKIARVIRRVQKRSA